MLGTTKYRAQYIPSEAYITAQLRQLLRKNCVWQWQHDHDEAVRKLKDVLINAPVLRFFDLRKQLVIQADASKDGRGVSFTRGPLSSICVTSIDRDRKELC